MTDLTKYTDKEELFDFLRTNKSMLIAEKKFEIKRADAVDYHVISENSKGETIKAAEYSSELILRDSIKVDSVINTTNLLDSHGDVHINGLWKKTLKEQKQLYLLQEHKMSFDSVISDNVKASTKMMGWSELGYNIKGDTEALIFRSEIEKDRNEYMFKQYAKGWVKNHSVGMRYVQLYLAINSGDSDYREEKEVWDKYIPVIANKSDAIDSGYFWAVTEAKLVEGSAVLIGSNWATPTQSVKSNEPPLGTQTIISGPEDPPANRFKNIINKLN